MFDLTYDRCVILLALMTIITLLSLIALACQTLRFRRIRQDNKVLKRSLRNLHARDDGASILSTLTRA